MSQSTPLPTLFLDIDDVLCLNKEFSGHDVIDVIEGRHPDPSAVYRGVFDPRATAALKQMHDALGGRLRYVVSSTWRYFFNRGQMATIFRATGLSFVADALHPAWRTATTINRDSQRADDIETWLDYCHAGEAFAIVDDSWSGYSLKPALVFPRHWLAGRVVLCQTEVGLRDEHVPVLTAALTRPV